MKTIYFPTEVVIKLYNQLPHVPVYDMVRWLDSYYTKKFNEPTRIQTSWGYSLTPEAIASLFEEFNTFAATKIPIEVVPK